MNRFETLLMNNPVRSFIQRRYEAPRLARLAHQPLEDAVTLVVGCGRGVDVRIAFDQYKVGHVTAIDLDEAQVDRARKLLGENYAKRLKLQTADVSALPFADESFDLVLDFGIIHHVPDWQKAVDEIQRVLKPGGQFLFEEIPGHKLHSWHYRTFSVHPRENRFEPADFRDACEAAGLMIGDHLETFFGFFRGAAVKNADAA